MHLAPALRSLKIKRNKLLQHFRRRHTTDSAAPVPTTTSSNSPLSTGSGSGSTPSITDRRRSTPPEVPRSDYCNYNNSHPDSHSVPNSTRTRRDSCYTFHSPEENNNTRQVEEAAILSTNTTAEPPSPTNTTTIDSIAPTSPKFEEHPPPLLVEVAPAPAPGVNTPTTDSHNLTPTSTPLSPTPPRPAPSRRQSLFPQSEISRITESLRRNGISLPEEPDDYEAEGGSPSTLRGNFSSNGMVNGKVWVRRREGSATLVDLRDEDLVDNLKDAILKKYQNALARCYDAPDLQLRILPRGAPPRPREERLLAPDELVSKTLEDYYPGGQSVAEALLIDVPPLRERERKTPRPSPNQLYAYYGSHGHDSFGPVEGNEYFPPMPAPPNSHPTNHPPSNMNSAQTTLVQPAIPAMTGQPSSIPGSPGSRRNINSRPSIRPRPHPIPPAVLASPVPSGSGTPVLLLPKGRVTRVNSEPSGTTQTLPPPAPPLPTPPIAEEATVTPPLPTSPPPARVASPRLKKFKNEQKSKAGPTGLMEGTVPPINVLIVEDNSINLKLLEAFMKRLKVRWQSAMNGLEAVNRWRAGGFHLVLMDIHLPVMNGLEATKEIRRLEKVNGIGVFSSADATPEDQTPEVQDILDEDKLPSTFLFKSPVIIVALTASSLQSDRHEALAAGCNDFLTKVRSGYNSSSQVSCPSNRFKYSRLITYG